MKYAKRHQRGIRVFQRGETFDGSLNTARFLYHRGILEPDGSDADALVTGPKHKTPTWTEPGEDMTEEQ
jgi:hypothetical protein